jgi:hypothetical protein
MQIDRPRKASPAERREQRRRRRQGGRRLRPRTAGGRKSEKNAERRSNFAVALVEPLLEIMLLSFPAHRYGRRPISGVRRRRPHPPVPLGNGPMPPRPFFQRPKMAADAIFNDSINYLNLNFHLRIVQPRESSTIS